MTRSGAVGWWQASITLNRMASPHPPEQPPQGPYQPPIGHPPQPWLPAGYPQQPAPPPQMWPPQQPGQPYPPPTAKKGTSTGMALLIACGVVAAACVVLGIIGAAMTSSTTNRTSGNQPAADATTTAPAAPTTKAAPPAGAQAIRAWFDAGGDTRLGNLSRDFDTFHNAAAKADHAGARAACVSIQADVEAAQAYRPIPDDQAHQAWSAALAAYARAATDCVASVDTLSPDLLLRANREMLDGNDGLGRVTARIKALSG